MISLAALSLIIATFLLSVFFNHGLKKMAPALGLIAYSGEHRQHAAPTPLIGGIAMFLAMVVVVFVSVLLLDWPLLTWSQIDNYLIATALLMIVGVIDDRNNISFLWRFLTQIVAVFIMIQQGTALLDLGELFSENTLSLGAFSSFLTVFAAVGVINALNMSDGVDGLVGSYFLIALVVLASFTFNPLYQLITFVWIGAVLGFLMFNFPLRGNAKIFMGDAGSMVLGFTLAWLLIHGAQDSIAGEPSLFHPIFAVWLLALPLYDTVSVMLIRLLKGHSPFHADRMHMHHHVLRRLKSTKISILILLLWFSVYILIGLYCHLHKIEQSQQTMLFSIFFILHFILQFRLSYKKR